MQELFTKTDLWQLCKTDDHLWSAEIDNFPTQLRRHLTTNLSQHLEQEFNNIYQDDLKYIAKKLALKPCHKIVLTL